MRYWKGRDCIIDLDEVCAISVVSHLSETNYYEIIFKNGKMSHFYGTLLIKQFEDYAMRDK